MSFLKLIGNGFTFKGKNGKEYTILPATLVHFGKYVNWLQYAPYRASINAELPKHKQDEIFAECSKGVTKVKLPPDDWDEDKDCPEEKLIEKEVPLDLFSPVVSNSMYTLEGTLKLARIVCPELDQEDIFSVIDKSNLPLIHKQILRINGLIQEEEVSEKDKKGVEKNV